MSLERALVPRFIPFRRVMPLTMSLTQRRLLPSTMIEEMEEGISFIKSSSSPSPLPSLCFLCFSPLSLTTLLAFSTSKLCLLRILPSLSSSMLQNSFFKVLSKSSKLAGFSALSHLCRCSLDLYLQLSLSLSFASRIFILWQLLPAIILILSSGRFGKSFWYSATNTVISWSRLISTCPLFSTLSFFQTTLLSFSCKKILVCSRFPFDLSISLMTLCILRFSNSSQRVLMSSALRLYSAVTFSVLSALRLSFSSTLLTSPSNLWKILSTLLGGMLEKIYLRVCKSWFLTYCSM